MSRVIKLLFLAIICIALAGGTFLTVMILRARTGTRDQGVFAVQSQANGESGRRSFVVERSDNAALSGNTFYVMVSDHLPNRGEMSAALHQGHVAFAVGRGGFITRWKGVDSLEVVCEANCPIYAEIVETRLNRFEGVEIRYVGFPDF